MILQVGLMKQCNRAKYNNVTKDRHRSFSAGPNRLKGRKASIATISAASLLATELFRKTMWAHLYPVTLLYVSEIS